MEMRTDLIIGVIIVLVEAVGALGTITAECMAVTPFVTVVP